MSFACMYQLTCMNNSINFFGVSNKMTSKIYINDGDILCSVPLHILIPKLTLKSANELANLHDLYMPSKILLKNAHILLENHKCETCLDLLALFTPYKKLPILSINRLGIKKIKRNVLMINSVL